MSDPYFGIDRDHDRAISDFEAEQSFLESREAELINEWVDQVKAGKPISIFIKCAGDRYHRLVNMTPAEVAIESYKSEVSVDALFHEWAESTAQYEMENPEVEI